MRQTVGAALLVFGLLAPASAQQVLFVLEEDSSPDLLVVEPTTGAILTAIPIDDTENPSNLAWDGVTLWALGRFNVGSSQELFSINPVTAEATVVGETGLDVGVSAVKVDPSTGTLYAFGGKMLYTIDKATGVATFVADIEGDTPNQITAFAIRRDGIAFLTGTIDVGLFRLNLETGVSVHLGDLNIGDHFEDLTFDESGLLWGSTIGGADTSVFLIDTETATAAFLYLPRTEVSTGTHLKWDGMAFGPSILAGFSVDGISSRSATCRNVTTGNSVVISLQQLEAWNCETEGVTAQPGDVVSLSVTGTAEDSPFDFRVAVTGFFPQRVTCRNTTLGETIQATIDPGSTSWNCDELGLTVNVGDRIASSASGRVR